MLTSPRERAEALLTIHGGSCSVSVESDIATTFRAMEREGLVKITRPVTDTRPQMLNARRLTPSES